MDSFLRSESNRCQYGRISGLSLFWLALLAAANVFVNVMMQSPSTPPPSAPLRAAIEPSLVLLGELSAGEREAMKHEVKADRAISKPVQRLVALEPTPHEVCRIWGPFSEKSALDGVQLVVAAAGSVVEVKSEEISSAPDFLVYLDTGRNIDSARRFLKELESQSLDAYVIAGGDYMNSVSVGVFSNESGAVRQSVRLEDLGYEPRVQALERVQTVYHLVGRVPEAFRLQSHGHTDCPTIASVR